MKRSKVKRKKDKMIFKHAADKTKESILLLLLLEEVSGYDVWNLCF